MRIQSSNDIILNSVTALIAGASGVGKTTLAKTLQGSTLIVSCESGLLSLKGSSIDYVELEGANGVQKMDHLKSIMSEISESEYDNIYVDSLSEISQCLYEVAQVKYPDDKNTMQRYGYTLDMSVKLFKYFRDMKKNVIFTALEDVQKDDVGRRFAGVDVVGSFKNRVVSLCDFVFNLRIIKTNDVERRVLVTAPVNGIVAKTRASETSLDNYEDANLSAIFSKLQG